MEDIRLNLEQVENGQEETPENGAKNADPIKSTLPGVLSMPILINAEPLQERKETRDSVEGSLGKVALSNEPLVGVENTDKHNGSTRKKSSVVRRQKRIRENRQLRKAMQPRNALKALNELKGIKMEQVSLSVHSGKCKAIVTVNGTQYVGHGSSNKSAKNAACEKALAEYMSHKLKALPLDGEDELTNDPEDDKSILNLASFALHKLFAEWGRHGLPIPTVLLPVNEKAEVFDRSELPNGWEAMNPVSVLCLMRPNISFLDVDASDDLQGGLKCVRVTVDSRSFTANGRSKKVARRKVAIAACNTLFGTNFTQPDTI